jgi:hypothetical protein
LMLGLLPNMEDREKTEVRKNHMIDTSARARKVGTETNDMFPSDMLVKTVDLIDWAKSKQMPGFKDMNAQTIGLLFRSNPSGTKSPMGFNNVRTTNLATQKKERKWAIPPLKVARDLWDTLRFPEEWGDMEDEWEPAPLVVKKAA